MKDGGTVRFNDSRNATNNRVATAFKHSRQTSNPTGFTKLEGADKAENTIFATEPNDATDFPEHFEFADEVCQDDLLVNNLTPVNANSGSRTSTARFVFNARENAVKSAAEHYQTHTVTKTRSSLTSNTGSPR